MNVARAALAGARKQPHTGPTILEELSMRVASFAIASAAVLLFSASAFAATSQTASTDQQSKDKLICKALYHEGMMVRSATQCHDQAYWDNVRWQQQQAVMDMQLRGDLQTGR
jgi:hypothetical protein